MRISDWSSDVCSSDLALECHPRRRDFRSDGRPADHLDLDPAGALPAPRGLMSDLSALVRAELALPVDPRVAAMAAAVAAHYPGPARPGLFSGICLPDTQLDGIVHVFYSLLLVLG